MEGTNEFDTVIESEDWRASAAIVGLIRVFDEFHIPYNSDDIFKKTEDGLDNLRFNREDLTEEVYLEYVERTYSEEMPHMTVLKLLEKDECDEELIKQVNENLKANTIMKNKFSKTKFDGENKNEIISIINENRFELIRETYRNKTLLYRNYCNTNQLFSESQAVCRLNGYYVDMPKKGKSVAHNFDTSHFVYRDEWFYDYIPLGFSYGHESFFINDNSSIKDLRETNNQLWRSMEREKSDSENGRVNARQILFQNIVESSKFIDLDTEVIIKESESKFFDTMIVRKPCVKILKNEYIKHCYKSLCFSPKVKENYINIQKEVTEAIIHLELLNDLIITLLKEDSSGVGIADNKNSYAKTIVRLIRINLMIKNEIYSESEGKGMKRRTYEAKSTAQKVAREFRRKKLNENKLRSYRTKLTTSMVFKDYTRFCEILLNLSDYSGVSMDFAYDLFEDFEKNQDLAFSFVNALTLADVEDENKKDKGDGEDE